QQLNFQQQIDVLVPTNLPTTGTVNVQLTTSTAFYPNYTLTMVPANPGFYRLTAPQSTTQVNVIAQFNGTAGLAEWLLDEVDKHACVARIRRMNWEEFRTLGMLPPEVLEAILQESRERMREAEAGPPRLSSEEQAF